MKNVTIKRIALLIVLVMMASCLSGLLLACQDALPQGSLKGEDPIYIMAFYTANVSTPASQIEPIKAAAGERITAPNTPSWPGYNFGGWYTDYGVWEDEFTDFSVMPQRNLVLYAKWEAVSENDKAEYEANLNANSQEGHLYIHYKRFVNTAEEYEKYNLWVWPKAFTGIEFDWVRDESGNILVDALGGATCDVDLTKSYDYAGNSRDTITTFLSCHDSAYTSGAIFEKSNYMDSSIGFLIVDEASKQTSLEVGGMWVSDGGNQFIPKARDNKPFAEIVRPNGSVHIFATQEHVYDYSYNIADVGEFTDPYANDDGTCVSIANVNSSGASQYGIAATAGSGDSRVVEGVGYQIMVSSFADSDGDGYGDIRGIIDNLDYLESLSVGVLWLTPIQLSDSYHGYDIIDYKVVDPKYGTLDDYQELLEKAHEKGMTVIMDLVLNHTSINNIWFQKSSQLDPTYRSFYQWKNNETNSNLSESWHKFGNHVYSYYGKFATSMPELNYDYQGTRDAIVDVADYWLGLGVDGFRIDAVKHIYMADEVDAQASDIIIESYDAETKVDYSSNVTKNLNFFREFNARVKEKYPNAYIVGENFDGNAYNVAPYYQGLDSMLNFYMYYNFAQALDFVAASPQQLSGNKQGNATFTGGKNTASLLTDTWTYPGTLNTYSRYRSIDGTQRSAIDALFTSNHDVPRLLNNVIGTMQGTDWIAGTVDNSTVAKATGRAKVVMATMMTLPGISFIYYGDELGMSGNYLAGQTKTSPHVDRQYRQPFKWTTKDYDEGGSSYITHYSISGDTTYYVTWDSYNEALKGADEQALDSNSMLSYTKKWTKIKHDDPVFRYGSYSYLTSNEGVYAYTLSYNGKTYYVYHNFTQYSISSYKVGGGSIVYGDSGANNNVLPAYSTVVFGQ